MKLLFLTAWHLSILGVDSKLEENRLLWYSSWCQTWSSRFCPLPSKLLTLLLQARQQQAELAQQEWLQMQQAAQQAQMAAASASAAQQASSSQDEDEDDEMWFFFFFLLTFFLFGIPSNLSRFLGTVLTTIYPCSFIGRDRCMWLLCECRFRVNGDEKDERGL